MYYAQGDPPKRPRTALQMFALRFRPRAEKLVQKSLHGTSRVVHESDKARMIQAVITKTWQSLTTDKQGVRCMCCYCYQL